MTIIFLITVAIINHNYNYKISTQWCHKNSALEQDQKNKKAQNVGQDNVWVMPATVKDLMHCWNSQIGKSNMGMVWRMVPLMCGLARMG